MKRIIFIFLLFPFALNLTGQNKDKAIFREQKPGFYQKYILPDDRIVKESKDLSIPGKSFAVDLSSVSLPNRIELYREKQWHNSPVSQGATGTCWSFSTTSMLESEVYRLSKMKVKLSEIHTVYWEYVEKAGRFIRERGNSAFEEGSEANAVTRIWKKYGIVPYDSYTGLKDGRKYHNHQDMFNEMNNFLQSMKATSSWDEEAGLATIRAIMNHFIGEPPSLVTINGKSYTPVEYMTEIIKINPDHYVDILSYIQEPFYEKVEYKVRDNWWHNADYHNVPLDVFMATLKAVVRNGFTVSIGGDVSEPGFDRETQCAVVPDFDIPAEYINDDARQFRFSNNTTTDDHGLHLVGYLEKDGKDWYMIKDSGSGSRNNDPEADEFGYYFFSEDYVKLKMMDFMVHKDAVKDLLQKFR
ncbi:MAG: peptidase C1 [Bacteroidetes bacterium]|jgi:bleomycin hydrolase|nr:peptidase C1 [Bacteroidota bacterium]